MDEPCAKCGKDKHVNWCPAWLVWLCAECRTTRNYAELSKKYPEES